MEKLYRKCEPKAGPRHLFYFGKKTQNSHCMQEILLNKRCFERGSSRPFKKVNFIFSFEPSPF